MGRRLIAVVDDEAAFTDMVCELLADEGYATIYTHTPAEAYPLIRDAQPDVVILDIRMGKPDAGIDILTMLWLDSRTVRIPVIICSADSTFLQTMDGYLQGNCYALPKPFTLDALLDTITTALHPQDETQLLARHVNEPERLH